MNPSRLFILRPVATSLLMIAIFLAGVVSYTFLPISALPEVDYPTIQIQTFYPGASAEVMTTSVTAPLERQLGQMPSLEEMSSSSSAGASIITLRFNLNLNLDIAEQEVQAAINAANNLLPSDLPAPPIYAKVNPADAPILTLALTSKTVRSLKWLIWPTRAWRKRCLKFRALVLSGSAPVTDLRYESALTCMPWPHTV